MKNLLLLLLFLSVFHPTAFAQPYVSYSDSNLTLNSNYLKQEIQLNLHEPITLPAASAQTKYPITIIFDSQHSLTYPYIIRSFDLLTLESLMPENLIIGVPLNRQNRWYLTSDQTHKGDSLMGLERMEHFLFEELIPHLQKEHHGGEHITIIGHSRTAFLVNYLVTARSASIDVALALSGFYQEPPLAEGKFSDYLKEEANFPSPLKYYATTGTSKEEATYRKQNEKIQASLANHSLPKNLHLSFQTTPQATHIVNFWNSIPNILLDVYKDYGTLIDEWLYVRLKDSTLTDPVSQFKADLAAVNQKLNFEANPSLTHIFSIASDLSNQRKAFESAIDFIHWGQQYYPNELDFQLYLLEFYTELKLTDKFDAALKDYKQMVASRTDLSEAVKKEYLQYVEEF